MLGGPGAMAADKPTAILRWMPDTLFARHLPAALEHLRRADPVIAGLIDQIPPLSGAVERDRFLSLVSAIVNQQLSGKAAATIMGRLLALFPATISPEAVLATPVERLREAGSRARRRATCSTSRSVSAQASLISKGSTNSTMKRP